MFFSHLISLTRITHTARRVVTSLLLVAGLIQPSIYAHGLPRASDRTTANAATVANEIASERGAGAQLTKDEAGAALRNLPLSFEPNVGQMNSDVKFFSRGNGYSVFLKDGDAEIVLNQAGGAGGSAPSESVLRMSLEGANSNSRADATGQLPGKVNYLASRDAAQWRTNVPTYGRVKYAGVYDDINLVYYGNRGQLEYDFIVAPGGDPRTIRLRFEGAIETRLDDGGDLVMSLENGGEIRQPRPFVYQEVGGARRKVDGRFILGGDGLVGFGVGDYDRTLPLVIDPVVYSTYLGGSSNERNFSSVSYDDGDIKIGPDGSIYVTGATSSSNFPTTPGTYQTTPEGTEGGAGTYVARLNPAGTALIYSTYLGKTYRDEAVALAVDADGNAYVAGSTFSNNLPTTPGAYQTTRQSSWDGTDAYVLKLSANGSSILYGTYIGVPNNPNSDYNRTWANDIALDPSGNIYVLGSTQSSLFPTTPGALQTTPSPYYASNGFLLKLNASGSTLAYSTYWPTNFENGQMAMAVDAQGCVYVTGFVNASLAGDNFPVTPNAFQPTHGGGERDAYVSKVNASGTGFVFLSYLGGSNRELARALTLDADNNVYVTGSTMSQDFPTTPGAFSRQHSGSQSNNTDAFVTKISSDGTQLLYSTFISEGVRSSGYGIAVDQQNRAFVTGFQSVPGEYHIDAFVKVLSASGGQLEESVVRGGVNEEWGVGIALNEAGEAFVLGLSNSADFPTTPNAVQPAHGGGYDAFIFKVIVQHADLSVTNVYEEARAVVNGHVTFHATITNHGPHTAREVRVTDLLTQGLVFVSCQSDTGQPCVGDGLSRTLELAELASGQSVGLTVVAFVDPTILYAGSFYSSTFDVTAQVADPQYANNSAEVHGDVIDSGPQLSLPANITARSTQPGGANVTFAVTATDNLDPAPVVECSPVSGSLFPYGMTDVNCSATDSAGNTTYGYFTVTVFDGTPPTLNLPGNVVVYGSASRVVNYSVTASDNLDPAPRVSCKPPSGSTFRLGVTPVTCTATDASGNKSTGTFSVHVKQESPTF